MDEATKFSPPYNVPWATFLSTIERIAGDPPGRVDRSYLDSMAGNTQTYVIAALKGFGLIDSESRPTGVLAFAVVEDRKSEMASVFKRHYGGVIPLGETNSTQGQLNDAFAETFPNITGDSRVKAVRFFLAGMAYAELPISSLWSSVKAPRGTGASSRRTGTSSRSKGRGVAAETNGASENIGGTTGPLSLEEMRGQYFLLLQEKAKSAENADDLLDRIERLVGVATTETSQTRGGDRHSDATETDEV